MKNFNRVEPLPVQARDREAMSEQRTQTLRELSARMREVDRARAAAVRLASVPGASLTQQSDVQFWVGYYGGLLEAKRIVKERIK